MVMIALIGADGAGKTSVARRLEEEAAIRAKYVYMGVNPRASNHALPTTRLVFGVRRWLGKDRCMGGPPDPRRRTPREGHALKRVVLDIRSMARLVNQLCEEWYRQWVAWCYERRGYVVLFDRHFYADYYAHDIRSDSAPRPLSRRIHGLVLNNLYPRPDLIILLDAPPQVLFDRKGEGTIELLERRRQEYLRLRGLLPNFAVVRVDQPLDAVVGEVLYIIRDFRDFRESRGRPDSRGGGKPKWRLRER